MTHNTDNFDFQELRGQYKLLGDTLEKQGDIDDELINEAVRKRLSDVKKRYRFDLWFNLAMTLLAALILLIFVKWQLAVSLAAAGALGFFRQRKEYQMLDFDKWCGLSMAEAREKVAEFKKSVFRLNLLMFIPLVLLLVFGLLYIDLSAEERVYAVAFIILLGVVGSYVGAKRSVGEANYILSEVEDIRRSENNEIPPERKRARDSFPILLGTYIACFILAAVLFRICLPSVNSFLLIALTGTLLGELVLNLIDRKMRKK